MHARFILKPILFILIMVKVSAVIAAPSDDFDAGVKSFTKQNYAQALDHFLRAENGGMADARLLYNLGSVYYKLEQYERSKSYFESLVDDENLGALAYYNLGLIEHKAGQDRSAIELFEKSSKSTQDASLQALAYKQIETLRGRQQKPWFGFASASYGYDSNITLLPSSAASDEAGDFLQLLALADWKLHGNTASSFHATALYLNRDFRDSNSFDDDSITLGAEYRNRIDNWKLTYGLELGQSTFGGEDYLATTGLIIRAKTGLSNNREVRLRLNLEDISSRSDQFDFLDGNRLLFQAGYRLKIRQHEFRFEYDLETNDRENTATENFSPTRNRIGVRYFDKISRQTRLGTGIDYRVSDYESVPSQDRYDKRSRIRFDARHKLNPTWTIQAELLFTNNQSSEKDAEYGKYLATSSINALF